MTTPPPSSSPLVERVAKAISGAPFPSAASKRKALAAVRVVVSEACNAIARIDRATLSLKSGEFELQGWRDAKAALAVAENALRNLLPSEPEA